MCYHDYRYMKTSQLITLAPHLHEVTLNYSFCFQEGYNLRSNFLEKSRIIQKYVTVSIFSMYVIVLICWKGFTIQDIPARLYVTFLTRICSLSLKTCQNNSFLMYVNYFSFPFMWKGGLVKAHSYHKSNFVKALQWGKCSSYWQSFDASVLSQGHFIKWTLQAEQAS